MPYRVDLPGGTDATIHRLIELGAIDVETSDVAVAALMPDSVAANDLAAILGTENITISPAVGRDDASVWVLRQRPCYVGRILLMPAAADTRGRAPVVRLVDAPAFGTGLHPTTALCVEALEDAIAHAPPSQLLDVGTGSGVLALSALTLGVERAVAVDVDEEAVRVAAENARINGLDGRMRLVRGGPDALAGAWPLVVANILAAPLIEMAPVLARRVGHHGRLILSGIPRGVGEDVQRAYVNVGMRSTATTSRAGWVALVLQATW